MRRNFEHHPAVEGLAAADQALGAQPEVLAETGLVRDVEVEMDAVERAAPFAAGRVARLAHLIGECCQGGELGAGHDEIDVVAHRPTGAEPGAPAADEHGLRDSLVHPLEHRAAALGELRRIEARARRRHR